MDAMTDYNNIQIDFRDANKARIKRQLEIGYWCPYEPLVWNQGFPTPLGGLSVSTNSVKAQDIRFSSSEFCNQQ
ncbi:unnamed protein product [Schistosoma curassoni]|uniref:Tnp_DDE_dom domain-containing protein n=1 Tax=Schistosoma curassoni TaxID=6186 RepID=A0A183KRW6_9TREM|nr:unnamed protein product [Schistosoma curassoni]